MSFKECLAKVPNRVWLYATAFIAGFLIVFLPLLLLEVVDIFYSIFWGLFSAVLVFIITRTVYHVAVKDASAETWAESIYAFVADLGWLIGIISTSWTVAIIGIVVMIVGGIMSICTRFVGKDGIKAREAELLENLKSTLRYRYMGDTLDGRLDSARYLVNIAGEKDPLTVNQAIAKGYQEEAEDAIAYIKTVIANSMDLTARKK